MLVGPGFVVVGPRAVGIIVTGGPVVAGTARVAHGGTCPLRVRAGAAVRLLGASPPTLALSVIYHIIIYIYILYIILYYIIYYGSESSECEPL